MQQRAVLLMAILLPLAAVTGCGGGEGPTGGPPELSLAVAASLTDVIVEVGDAFTAERDVEMIYNFAGSGALAQQLLAAPRADVFVSASERWMDEVEAGGRLLAGSRRSLLSNSLVGIGSPDSELRIRSAADLCDAPFEYLSIGDPESVPAGHYTRRWLEVVACPDGNAVWSRVRGRIAPAPDVRAALTQVLGSTDVVGIVYRTDYFARRDEVELLFEMGPEGPTIRYPVAIVDSSTRPELAAEFLVFLASPEATRIFEEHGFLTGGLGATGAR